MNELTKKLLSRSLNPEDYNVLLDEENQVATFLLYGLTGKLLGYQQYRPLADKKGQGKYDPRELRYFTYLTKAGPNADSVAVFGTDRFNWKNRVVYLVEGVFDACKLHNLGQNAFAVLCNNPVQMRAFLRALGMKVVGVLDGDAAGSALAKLCDEVFVCPAGRDPGDMTETELRTMLNLPL
jgi:hypothetical protein